MALAAGCAQAGAALEARDSGPDSTKDAEVDAATDAGEDVDAPDASEQMDAAADNGRPTAADASEDAASEDAATEYLTDGGADAAMDAEADADVDTGADPGPGSAEGSGDGAASNGCVPGTYAGAFEGKLAYLGLPLFDISGDIEIEALTSDTGDELRIENGSIEGADEDGNPVHAEVHGVMDCATYELRDGTLSNGTYVRTAFDMTVDFDGEIQATYRPGPAPTVTGTWQADGGSETGRGTFAATLVRAAP